MKEKVGSGSYGTLETDCQWITPLTLAKGKVYHASDLVYDHDVAVKIEPESIIPSVLKHEHHVLCQLDGITGTVVSLGCIGLGMRLDTMLLSLIILAPR